VAPQAAATSQCFMRYRDALSFASWWHFSAASVRAICELRPRAHAVITSCAAPVRLGRRIEDSDGYGLTSEPAIPSASIGAPARPIRASMPPV